MIKSRGCRQTSCLARKVQLLMGFFKKAYFVLNRQNIYHVFHDFAQKGENSKTYLLINKLGFICQVRTLLVLADDV
jgi:hypothetical protein